MSLQTGALLHGRYRVERQLGKGGMGAVYLALDETLQIPVAVKENLSLNPESERQFRREATLLATLRHPNLPRVTDHFILDERQYLVMDYIEGEDLHTRSARQLPTVAEALGWADHLCDALAYLHSRQPPIIHRDIKPSNLKLQPDGRVVLVDFGIAKVADQTATTTGARGLTPGFSPPEQYGGTRTDARSDQYSLAATLYALLTGRAPADSIERMLSKEVLTPVRALNPALPAYAEAALDRALSIEQDQRFPDITAFRSALRGTPVAETVRAAPAVPGAATRPAAGAPPWRRRPVVLLAGVGAFGLVALGAAALGLRGAFPGTAPPVASVSDTPSPTAAASLTATPAPPSPTPAATPTRAATPTDLPPLLGGGGRIAFVSDREGDLGLQIWTMNPDGTAPRQLTFGPGDKLYPAWSPDGRRLAFVVQTRASEGDLWSINADGSGLSQLTRDGGEHAYPAWSPDGTQIAYSSDRLYQTRQTWVVDVSCEPPPAGCSVGTPRDVSRQYAVESSPAWDPLGGRLAVSISINQAPGRIHLRTLDGAPPTLFDRSETLIGIDNLAWSPDGSLLAFDWFRARIYEIYVVSAGDPRAWTRLTNSAGNRDPAFSPDGLYIAFTSTRDQNPEIYRMGAGGADQRNLTNHPARDLYPAWQPAPR